MKSIRNLRILITGVQGQVGFELVKSLSTNGAQLLLAARRPQALSGLGYSSVALDLSSEQNIREVFDEIKPDLVINAAAYTAVDKAEDNIEEAYAVNHRSIGVMTEALHNRKGALIHISTDYVYNSDHSLPNLESDGANPENIYARSKREGEKVLENSDLAHLILRTSWVYGINGNNFVKTMIRLGKERESLRIVSDQIGSPTQAGTLSQAVASILHQGRSDPIEFIRERKGIYNLSDAGFTNWHDFAQEIFKQAIHLGIELKVTNVEGIKTAEYKTPASRPLNSRLSLEKIGQCFGIFPPTWQQSLGAFMHQSHLKLI